VCTCFEREKRIKLDRNYISPIKEVTQLVTVIGSHLNIINKYETRKSGPFLGKLEIFDQVIRFPQISTIYCNVKSFLMHHSYKFTSLFIFTPEGHKPMW